MHLLDTYQLSSLLPSEVVDGHVTPVLATWQWQLMLNTVGCAATAAHLLPTTGTPAPVEFSAGCRADTYNDGCVDCDCSLYRRDTSAGLGNDFESWECISARPCSFSATSVSTTSAAGMLTSTAASASVPCDAHVRVWAVAANGTRLSATDGLPRSQLLTSNMSLAVRPSLTPPLPGSVGRVRC